MTKEQTLQHFDEFKHVRFANPWSDTWVCLECVEMGITQGDPTQPIYQDWMD